MWGNRRPTQEPALTPEMWAEARRDHTRASLAFYLLALLAGEILIAFAGNLFWNSPEKSGFNTIATAVIGPTVALVSAATGFYYGTRGTGQSPAPPDARRDPPAGTGGAGQSLMSDPSAVRPEE
jgi:hypothetical protein